jgi:hypothetical protein
MLEEFGYWLGEAFSKKILQYGALNKQLFYITA